MTRILDIVKLDQEMTLLHHEKKALAYQITTRGHLLVNEYLELKKTNPDVDALLPRSILSRIRSELKKLLKTRHARLRLLPTD